MVFFLFQPEYIHSGAKSLPLPFNFCFLTKMVLKLSKKGSKSDKTTLFVSEISQAEVLFFYLAFSSPFNLTFDYT